MNMDDFMELDFIDREIELQRLLEKYKQKITSATNDEIISVLRSDGLPKQIQMRDVLFAEILIRNLTSLK